MESGIYLFDATVRVRAALFDAVIHPQKLRPAPILGLPALAYYSSRKYVHALV
jgi:hypothetical protein